MKEQVILIVGATSSLGRALAVEVAKRGARLHLSGRDVEEVERVALDIQIRYQTSVSWSMVDVMNYETHPQFIEKVIHQHGRMDGVIICVGELGDQQEAQVNFYHTQNIIHSNYTGVVSILNLVANYLEQQKQGFIIGVSSVAGDRGRQSNYIYGSAKGALSLYLQGLRQRLSKSGVHVLTVKPGYIDTKMTYLTLSSNLKAAPQNVAQQCISALVTRQNTCYTPWFWQPIMMIIKSVPEALFKKLAI